MIESRSGTKITVMQKCLLSSFIRKWDSQPSVGTIPIGNIMLSSFILFATVSPANVLDILILMNVTTISYSTFMKHQKKYLHPAVQKMYQVQQSNLIGNIKAQGRELILGGGMATVIVHVIQQSTAHSQSWMLSKTRLLIQSWFRFVNAYVVH